MSGKIIVDEIEKSAEGTGIKLNSPLLNSTGTEIMSAAGALSSSIDMTGVTFPAGHVVQVKSDTYDLYNTTTSVSSTTGLKILEVNLTPKFENSKFLIHTSISVCHRDYYTGFGTFFENVNDSGETSIFLSTDVNLSSFQNASITYRYGAAQDSSTDSIYAPYIISYSNFANTSYSIGQSIKYSLRLWTGNSSQPVYVNRGTTTSTVHYGKSVCTMIVMEIRQ